MPTIEEAIKAALVALSHGGFPEGGAVYDDLAQVLVQLPTETLDEEIDA